jgi:hypothetical protein
MGSGYSLWALAGVCGTVLLTVGCPTAEESEVPRGAAESPWPRIWPQDSREEAERAQAAVDRGVARYDWQLAPDGVSVALRYAREELGWSDLQGHDLHARVR